MPLLRPSPARKERNATNSHPSIALLQHNNFVRNNGVITLFLVAVCIVRGKQSRKDVDEILFFFVPFYMEVLLDGLLLRDFFFNIKK